MEHIKVVSYNDTLLCLRLIESLFFLPNCGNVVQPYCIFFLNLELTVVTDKWQKLL